MRLYGLIGYPLAQSFSKKYFNDQFRENKLGDCRFENFPISAITALPGLLKDQPDLKGFAVTIPYKQEVLPYLDDARGIPAGLNACNCIRIQDGLLYGFNTDYIGFDKSLSPLLQSHHTRALVLGNGGAAAAVIYALKQRGISVELVSRKIHAGSTMTYDDIDADVMKEHHLIVNTTPLGMFPETDSYPPIPYDQLTSNHLLYDLVYNPGMTRFLEKGAQQGAVTKNGGDMLYLQAEENWKIWNL